jgi:tripartite-type tricarboxylate transporter receptor subunit TctC
MDKVLSSWEIEPINPSGQPASPGRRSALASLASAAALPLGLLEGASIYAQEVFPSRPIRLLVPFATGSGTDNTARHISQRMGERPGWKIIVDNKPGANAFIGLQEVLRAPPDGYIITLTGGTTHGANSAMFKKLPYDPIADFIPIAPNIFAPLVLLAAPNMNVKTAAELLAKLRAEPGKHSFASGSAFQRLAGEIFKDMARVDSVHVAYKGSAQSMIDLLGGHVAYTFVDTAAAISQIRSGRLVPLAVTSAKRVPALPDVPTMAEAGLPDMRLIAWSAIFAPRGTPPAAVTELRRGFGEFYASEEWRKFSIDSGGYWEPMSGPELTRFIENEISRYTAAFRKAGIEPE